jgi:hypothetical protein
MAIDPEMAERVDISHDEPFKAWKCQSIHITRVRTASEDEGRSLSS